MSASYKVLIDTKGGIKVDGGKKYGSVCTEMTKALEMKLGQVNESSRQFNDAYEDDHQQELHQEL